MYYSYNPDITLHYPSNAIEGGYSIYIYVCVRDICKHNAYIYIANGSPFRSLGQKVHLLGDMWNMNHMWGSWNFQSTYIYKSLLYHTITDHEIL